jgi:hypothetical protein
MKHAIFNAMDSRVTENKKQFLFGTFINERENSF